MYRQTLYVLLFLKHLFSKLYLNSIIAYLFFALPAFSQSFDIPGHRGFRGLRPENSLPAFFKALDLGVSTLELDVVISTDRQVVVSHDTYMNAAFTIKPYGNKLIKAEETSLYMYTLDYAIIQHYDVGIRKNPPFSDP